MASTFEHSSKKSKEEKVKFDKEIISMEVITIKLIILYLLVQQIQRFIRTFWKLSIEFWTSWLPQIYLNLTSCWKKFKHQTSVQKMNYQE